MVLYFNDSNEVASANKVSNPELKNIPVIIISAKGEELDVVLGLELGADDYLPKPFSPRILFSRIKAVLRRGKEQEKTPKTISFENLPPKSPSGLASLFSADLLMKGRAVGVVAEYESFYGGGAIITPVGVGHTLILSNRK